MEWIELEGGAKVFFNDAKGQCKSCEEFRGETKWICI